MNDAIRFFHQHAGWSHDPRTETPEAGKLRCATQLADAEAWGAALGIEVLWADDWTIGDHRAEYDCYEDGGPETCEHAWAERDGEILASLGCIDDATDEYRRVVVAELLAEARDTLAAEADALRARWADVDRWLSLA